jgi:hypothetical protein
MKVRRRVRLLGAWACGAVFFLSVAGWVFTRFYQVFWYEPSGHVLFCLYRGQIGISVSGVATPPGPRRPVPVSAAIQVPWDWYPDLGFGINPAMLWLSIPLWLPALLAPTLVLMVWGPWRQRIGPGCCTKCGYDRAGLTESVKCPECGVIPGK